MFYIYIIYSTSANKYYVGYSEDPWRRLFEHNNKPFNSYTSKHRPWVLKAVFQCGFIEKEAIAIERFIKNQKSRAFIEKILVQVKLVGPLAQLVRVPHLRD